MNALARLFSFLTCALIAGLIAALAIPGPQRALFPAAFGLTEIAPQVWTDAPGDAPATLAMVDAARARVSAFFGDAPPRPPLILCAAAPCADDFRITANGLSLAGLAVVISPKGLTEGTLTHELTHARLHRPDSLSQYVRAPFPAWFDEGLATVVAAHPVRPDSADTMGRKRVIEARRFWQWGTAMRALGVSRAYAAAAAEVAAIEARTGHAALLDFIERVRTGADFDRALSKL